MAYQSIGRWNLNLAAGALLITAALMAQPAWANPCAPHDEVAGLLDKKHQEKRQAIGLTGNGQLLEIFVSEKGTWTAVLSTPAGHSCITAAGEGWENGLASFAPES